MESSSIFKPLDPESNFVCSGTKKFLHTPLGQKLECVVLFNKNRLNVYDLRTNTMLHTFEFPEDAEVIDVDYFPETDGSFGIVVAVHDESASWGSVNFVVGLTGHVPQWAMKISWSLDLPERTTIIKTLFTNEDLATNQNGFKLYSKLEQWDHIVAIGSKNSHCYIAQLAPQKAENSEKENLINVFPQNYVDILAGFAPKGKNIFNYSGDDVHKKYPASSVSVTALALLPRSRTLLVGLSMGGIISASLNPSNQMKQLDLRHERLIRYLAPLEPEDDPERYEYFIAAADGSPRHPLMIHLWRGCFKTEDSSEVDPETQYDRPIFYVALEHRLQYSQRWITAETMTHNRYMENGVSSQQNRTRRHNEDSINRSPNQSSLLNVSQAFGASLNRSSVLLAYERIDIITRKPIIEAGVFDIDSYYYKRMPSAVSDDRTILKQCPFLSTIRSNLSAEDVHGIGIMISSPLYFSRFSSTISDADQLFFPSSLNFKRVFIAKYGSIEKMEISCLQDTILDHVSSNLPKVLVSPTHMAEKILSAGIVPMTVLQGSPNSSMNSSLLVPERTFLSNEVKVILNAMLYYRKLDELNRLTTSPLIEDDVKKQIAEWAFYEACDFRKVIVDRTCSVFDGSAASLSPVADSALSQGTQLFFMVQELLLHYSEHLDNNSQLAKFATAVKCCSDHTRLVRQFINYGVVPTDVRIEKRMRESHEAKVRAAMKNKVGLPIQMLVRRLDVHTNGEMFWNDKPHDQWYPPNPCDLLEPILFTKIPDKLKRELIIQYVVDWIRASNVVSREALTDGDIAKQAHRTISDHLLGTNSERILFVLEQEKEATKVRDERRALVFADQEAKESDENDDGSWADLWSPKILLTDRLSENDKQKFEKIYRIQKEQPFKKLPKMDDREERLYQYYLYTRRKYSDMSEDAIKSNKFLSAFFPHLVSKKGKEGENDSKSDKEKEVENAVKNMFQKFNKNKETNEAVIQPKSIFDTMSTARDPPQPSVIQKVKEMNNGKKRRSVNVHDENKDDSKSPLAFSQPVAKRALVRRSPPTTNSKANASPAISSSIATDRANTTDDDLIHAAIQTPAKYLRRPQQQENDNAYVSPVNRPAPSAVCPNSILKTAKAVQSPSRGRIRFHESVPRAIDESLKEGPSFVGTLNFDIDEDDDEVLTEVQTTSELADDEDQISEKNEALTNGENEDGMEMEKSWEAQEEHKSQEFDVYEDSSSGSQKAENVPEENLNDSPETIEQKEEAETVEKTSEIADELAIENVDNVAQEERMDETFDIPQDIEERLNRIESVTDTEEDVIERYEEEDIDMELDHGVTTDRNGVEKSFEIQHDSDHDVDKAEEQNEEPLDIVQEKIFAESEKDEVPKEHEDIEVTHEAGSSPSYSDNVEEEMDIEVITENKDNQKEDSYELPVTRSRCNSRCDSANLNPDEQKEKEDDTPATRTRSASVSAKDTAATSTVRTTRRSKSRTPSRNEVIKTPDENGDLEVKLLNESGLAKRTLARTPKPLGTASKKDGSPTAAEPTTAPRSTRRRAQSEVSSSKPAEAKKTPLKRATTRTPSRSRATSNEPEVETTEKPTPKKTRATSRSRNPSITILTEETEEVQQQPRTPRKSGRISVKPVDLVEPADLDKEASTPKKVTRTASKSDSAKKATPSRSSSRSRASKALVPEVEEPVVIDDTVKTPTRRSRSNSTSSVTRKGAASAKKVLEPIEESEEKPKRSVGRPRASSTVVEPSKKPNWRDRFAEKFKNDEKALEVIKRTRRARTTSATGRLSPTPSSTGPSGLDDVEEEKEPVTPRRSTRRTPRL